VNSSSILYIGSDSGTSQHRASALKRLSHQVVVVDPAAFLPRVSLANAWSWHTGGMLLENFIRRKVLASIGRQKFEVVYVDGGALVGPSLVRELKSRFGTVINYNIDDPYGQRDGRRFRLYLKAIPFYDLVVVVRDCNVPEAYARGARNVLRVFMAADEKAHAPKPLTEQDRRSWPIEVGFVGTWMPERGPFMARLVELGVPLTIYGSRWQKAPEWPSLRGAWRGGGLYGDDYGKALACAKINLGLLSKENRDLTTTRSFEIPYLGGVLCAERTSEHTQLYKEDEDAIFWSTPQECASKCIQLLRDEPRRQRLAINGHRRCMQNHTTNEAVLAQILCKAVGPEQLQPERVEAQVPVRSVLTPVLSEAYRT
jgi:spore maturation protein CgeB